MGDIVKRSQSQKDVLDKIRRSVPASEVSLGSVALNFRCSTTKKGYQVLLKKETDGRYKVGGVVSGGGGGKQATTVSPAAESLDINVNDIDLYSIRCPHCQGGKWPFLKCGCGGLSCSGGVKLAGERYEFVCPWCGYMGYIQGTGTLESVTGRAARKGQLPEGHAGVKSLPPSSTNRMLDKGSQ
jgi:hypothetical protein